MVRAPWQAGEVPGDIQTFVEATPADFGRRVKLCRVTKVLLGDMSWEEARNLYEELGVLLNTHNQHAKRT